MNIIILGPQGSGKGTQARILAEKQGLFYMEMGSFLREVAKNNAEIDEMVNKKGTLVPDETVFSLLKNFLNEKKVDLGKIVFDGYPRSIGQYNLLNTWLKENGQKIDFVFFISISDAESIKRLSVRRSCSKCGAIYNLITNPPKGEKCDVCGGDLTQREDDKQELIQKRLEVYKANTQPLLDVLSKEGILFEVNGERPINVIAEDLQKLLSGN
jgi:adenylate kinase